MQSWITSLYVRNRKGRVRGTDRLTIERGTRAPLWNHYFHYFTSIRRDPALKPLRSAALVAIGAHTFVIDDANEIKKKIIVHID